MPDLTAYIASFNCARVHPSPSHLASALFANTDTSSPLPPDLIVLSLQEIAPIGYAFLGGSFLTPYFSRIASIVQDAVSSHFEAEPDYGALVVRNVGLTALMVFAKRELRERVRWVETAGVGLGVWEMGNKGAVGARFGLDSENGTTVPVTFVAAHLAPMEGNWQRRNQDWRNICENLVFTRDDTTSQYAKTAAAEARPLLSSSEDDDDEEPRGLFSPLSHLFLAGDLNYRTSDVPPQPSDHKTWPHPSSHTPASPHQNDPFSPLRARDQLTRELNARNTFHLLSEPPLTFPPTYKYSSAAQRRAAENRPLPPASDPDADVWAKHRIPSWCDRILYLAASRPQLNVKEYDALAVQPTSDHRPLALWAEISLTPPQGLGGEDVPFKVREGWRERREAARRLEVFVGLGAYLALTWEGELLVAGTLVGVLGGWVALSALLGWGW